ncbi:MAG TPA: DUF1552 domain-containing protein [Polyangiaceae bacterium]
MTRLGRRAFLSALGASGALFAFDDARGDASAVAAKGARGAYGASGKPLRLVCVYMPHGRAHELWQPRPGFDIAFPDATLAPFDDPAGYGRSFKRELLVVDGVDLSAGIAAGTTGHDAPRAIFTGSGADGKNPSVEQFLADERGLGADTPHTSVVLGVGNDASDILSNVSWARGGTAIPKWIDPAQTFAELFGAPLGARQEELERERKAGKSVLDAVRGDLGRLRARAPASERAKLEQHAQSLREIEKRLVGVRRDCVVPDPPDRARFPRLRAFGGGEPYLDAVTDLQIDLLARAIACDITRFSSLFLADLTRSGLVAGYPVDVHGEVAHRYDARSDRHPGNPSTWHALGVQNRYTHSKLARLLQRLDESGVLADTLVYASSDMGDPALHSSRNVPTLLLGGAGGRFAMGRYIDLRRPKSHDGTPNNRILVSICQAFGVEIDRFGHAADAAIVTGRLEELYG